MRDRVASLLLFAAVLALAAALVTVLTGGIIWPAIHLSSRDPWRPLVAGVVLLAAARAATDAVRFRGLARIYTGTASAMATRVAVLAAASVFVFAIAWSSRAAGGSDSSCYVLQAEAFAEGHATLRNPVAAVLPDVPNAVFAPTGFLASPREYGAAVPICGAGLSLIMAAAYLIHPAAVFFVVPLSGALLVWLTFVYGRRLDDEVTGACAAVLTACSPIFLYQVVQPMSDVPAAAAFLAALTATVLGDRRGFLVGGLCASLAVLARPNLALPIVPLLFLPAKRGQSPFFAKNGDNRLFWFAAGATPAILVLLALNTARYGAPLATGYGSAEALFTRAHVYANLLRYPRWVLETQTPLVLLALAAPWTVRRDPARARLAWISLVSVTLLVGTYLAYTVFDDWWYIRFLVPALPIAIALSVTALRAAVLRVAALRVAALRAAASRATAAATAGTVAICAVLSVWYVHVARDRHAMALQSLESRFALAGAYAARALPARAVVLAVQQSGSIRFHGHRDTIAWDQIPEGALDETLARLARAGRTPYLALEDGEDERFRLRFGAERAGRLDWPPVYESRSAPRVRWYAVTPQR